MGLLYELKDNVIPVEHKEMAQYLIYCMKKMLHKDIVVPDDGQSTLLNIKFIISKTC